MPSHDDAELPLFETSDADQFSGSAKAKRAVGEDLNDTFGKYIVYVDESGDHGMQSIDENCPVFVLGNWGSATVLVGKGKRGIF